jgi:hypothetical protein
MRVVVGRTTAESHCSSFSSAGAVAAAAAPNKTLAEHYDLHPLAIEDVINFQRIKCIR